MTDTALKPEMLCQVGFVVHDVVATAKKFVDYFGYPMPPIIQTPGFAQSKTTVNGQASEATAKLAFFNTGQMQIELIEPDEKPSTWRDHLDKHGEGIHHIAFRVNNTKATEDALSKWGITTEQQGLYTDGSGMYTYLDSTSVLGVTLELLENFEKKE